MSDLNVEVKILSYLWIYGSTKESDIVDYGVRRLEKSKESMEEILNRMDDMGRIRKIVHNELEPPAIYVNIGLTLEFELELQQSADSLGIPTPNQEDAEEATENPQYSVMQPSSKA